MSFEQARNYIATKMDAEYATTVVAYDNHEFTPPNDGSSWVRLTVVEGESNIAGLGDSQRLFRNVGVIICQIFVQDGKGSKAALDIADILETIWGGASFNGITCRASSVTRVGADNGWYQVNVSTPYFWDNIK